MRVGSNAPKVLFSIVFGAASVTSDDDACVWSICCARTSSACRNRRFGGTKRRRPLIQHAPRPECISPHRDYREGVLPEESVAITPQMPFQLQLRGRHMAGRRRFHGAPLDGSKCPLLSHNQTLVSSTGTGCACRCRGS